MTKVLQSPWLASALGAFLYWSTTVVVWPPQPRAEVHSRNSPAQTIGPSWTFQNPELTHFVEELKKEKERLVSKEAELNALAARLNAERQELNQVTQAIHQLQTEFDRSVTKVEEQESANLKKLARMYASMAPETAIQILKQMEDQALVKILALMKEAEVAPLLEVLGKQTDADAKRAAEVSDRLRLTLSKPTSALPGSR